MRGKGRQAETGDGERAFGGTFEGVVHALQDLAEHRVAGSIADRAMKGGVGGAVGKASGHDFQELVAQAGNVGALAQGGVLGGAADGAAFDDAAHVEQAQDRLTFKLHHGGQRALRGLHLGGQVGAVTAAAADQAEALPAVQGLADGGAADAESGGEGNFRRQAVADLQAGAFDHLGQGVQHGDAARGVVDGIEEGEGGAFHRFLRSGHG